MALPGGKQSKKDISDRREDFIRRYVGEAHFNGTRAAHDAGYAQPETEAVRLLRNAKVRARIDEILETRALSANAVLAELTEIASAEWRDFTQTRYTPRGESYETMDLAAKTKALELLGKAHRLFVERVENTGKDGQAIEFTISLGEAKESDGDGSA